jgi:hypothetical protein
MHSPTGLLRGSFTNGDKVFSCAEIVEGNAINVYRRDGAAGGWLIASDSSGLLTSGLSYNYWDTTTWQNVALSTGEFVNYYVIGWDTLDASPDVVVIQGQHKFSVLQDALDETYSSLSGTETWAGAEAPIYKITYERTSSGSPYFAKIAHVSRITALSEELHQKSDTTSAHDASMISFSPVPTAVALAGKTTAEDALNKLGDVSKVAMNLQIEVPLNKTYYYTLSSKLAFNLTKLSALAVSGAMTVSIKINGVELTGSSTAVGNTLVEKSFSSGNAVAVGDSVALVVVVTSAGTDLIAEISGDIV